MKKINYTLPVALMLTLPGSVFAERLISDPNKVPNSAGDVLVFINRVKNIALGLVGLVILVMVIYGGFLYMTSGGNEDRMAKAKQTLMYAFIGLALVVLSYGIVFFVVTALGGSIQ